MEFDHWETMDPVSEVLDYNMSIERRTMTNKVWLVDFSVYFGSSLVSDAVPVECRLPRDG